ncbi:hypothetical protein COY62_04220 [bacterium (Candidatus Howlettbacteria) CG_4_10_14_0_8_um_filter_40_9]|nr:MAG: hypothetical protein COY62_04220 [bacterium (Candidatus Howlettbacteria) CG_4_10_14_0_8_um_filter_40_9]
MAKVLIIESDEGTRYLYKTAISFQQIQVETAESVSRAIEMIGSFKPSLVLLDIMTPDLKNIDLLKELKLRIEGSLPLIILTDMREKDVQKEASIFGACEYLSKTESSVGDIIKKIRSVVK